MDRGVEAAIRMRVGPLGRIEMGSARGVGLAIVAALVTAACSAQREPEPELPPGLVVAGDAAALGRFLTSLERMEHTPAARTARTIRKRLEGCREFAAHAPSGELAELVEGIQCTPVEEQPAGLRELRGDGDLALAGPLGEDGRTQARIRIDANGSVEVDARIDPLPTTGLSAFLMPAEDSPGRPVLSSRNALIHGRLRPDAGLDLARWIRDDSQADALFKLKSELFAATVLAGNIEIATYLPQPGRTMPAAALAVDFSVRAAAVAAMEGFIADLEASWPLHHRPIQVRGHPGACFFDLRILPEFAPCYVATDRALVLGYNPQSLEEALDGEATSLIGRADHSRMVVELAQLPLADERLRESVASDIPPVHFDSAWDQLIVEGRRQGSPVHLRIALLAREPS